MLESVRSGARAIAALSLVLLPACASTATPTQRAETTYIGGSGPMTLTPGAGPYVKTIVAPLEQVWRALPTAYDSLGIPLTIIDPKTRVVGNEGMKLRQQLGKARLSSYFECGTTQVGPNADSYELYITVVSQLEADGPARTKVTTLTTASAKPMNFSQEYSRCSSKDVLEARILDVVSAALKR